MVVVCKCGVRVSLGTLLLFLLSLATTSFGANDLSAGVSSTFPLTLTLSKGKGAKFDIAVPTSKVFELTALRPRGKCLTSMLRENEAKIGIGKCDLLPRWSTSGRGEDSLSVSDDNTDDDMIYSFNDKSVSVNVGEQANDMRCSLGATRKHDFFVVSVSIPKNAHKCDLEMQFGKDVMLAEEAEAKYIDEQKAKATSSLPERSGASGSISSSHAGGGFVIPVLVVISVVLLVCVCVAGVAGWYAKAVIYPKKLLFDANNGCIVETGKKRTNFPITILEENFDVYDPTKREKLDTVLNNGSNCSVLYRIYVTHTYLNCRRIYGILEPQGFTAIQLYRNPAPIAELELFNFHFTIVPKGEKVPHVWQIPAYMQSHPPTQNIVYYIDHEQSLIFQKNAVNAPKDQGIIERQKNDMSKEKRMSAEPKKRKAEVKSEISEGRSDDKSDQKSGKSDYKSATSDIVPSAVSKEL